MNSLEFINQEIEEAKHEIKINEIRIENMYNKTFYEERAEVLNNKLQTLQQIKIELEAWEVVKKDIILDTDSYDCDDMSCTVAYAKFYTDDYEQLDKLYKALEVENEKSI